ncbi:Potassium transporter 23 [Hibiscus syriacus]|uniref:Potassium transporter 23 n=1 Tax=Hibiscus syriacus TaxID=106335 RepID=A0A6A2ZLF5_HIBSY|nr:Potassium transporter 23 [Hibiscus syriacus]
MISGDSNPHFSNQSPIPGLNRKTVATGFMFAPALALWFFSLGSIGIYNLVKYDIAVIRAFNPAYFFFFKNNKDAWSALGGCVLCITGAEAMFADLGHFSVQSIQIAFAFVVFPCLLFAYMAQAAYLMKYRDSSGRIFYDSVPDSLFWPILVVATIAAMIASQAMISATFSCVKQAMALVVVSIFRSTTVIANAYGIAEVGVMLVTMTLVTLVMLLIWQTNLFIALCFPLVFGSIELIYLSAVLSKVLEGGWLPLVFATFFLSVMYIWNYGSVLKYQSEVREKISMDFMHELGSTLGTEERFLFRRVCPKDYHMFRCIARYGYKDIRKEDHHVFEQLLSQSLENFLRKEAEDVALETGLQEMDIDSVSVSSRDYGTRGIVDNEDLRIPLMQDTRSEAANKEEASLALPSSVMSSDIDPCLEYELSAVREAIDSGFTNFLAHGVVRAKKKSFLLKNLAINCLYAFLRRNCRAGAANIRVRHMNILQVDPQITRNRSRSSLIARKPFGRLPPTLATTSRESSPPSPVEAPSRTGHSQSSTRLQSSPFVVEWCLKSPLFQGCPLDDGGLLNRLDFGRTRPTSSTSVATFKRHSTTNGDDWRRVDDWAMTGLGLRLHWARQVGLRSSVAAEFGGSGGVHHHRTKKGGSMTGLKAMGKNVLILGIPLLLLLLLGGDTSAPTTSSPASKLPNAIDFDPLLDLS